jgi:two-component system, OmpR family, KDP operon response regulator KdpE
VSTVLVVEDDTPLRTTLRAALQARGLDVIAVGTGEEAIAALDRAIPDLILLDLNLPGVDGFTVLARARAMSKVPVVVLTVHDDRSDKIRALDWGADDYITKPFDNDDLYARLRAALRRTPQPERPTIVRARGVEVDLAALRLTRHGTLVQLTPTEWRLLALLVRESGRLVTHARLLAELHVSTTGDANALRVHLNHLRHKLGDDGLHPTFIVNEPGLGYRWFSEPVTPEAADL